MTTKRHSEINWPLPGITELFWEAVFFTNKRGFHIDVIYKGQLISECLLGVIDFPKKQRKIWQISALESKKWSNQQSKSTFL